MAKWIQNMNMKKGAFTAKAKAAGKTVPEMTSSVIAKSKTGKKPGSTLLKEAILARTFSKMRHKKAAISKGA
jgi:hypothetical protein